MMSNLQMCISRNMVFALYSVFLLLGCLVGNVTQADCISQKWCTLCEECSSLTRVARRQLRCLMTRAQCNFPFGLRTPSGAVPSAWCTIGSSTVGALPTSRVSECNGTGYPQ